MATNKTIAPTNVTVQIPAMTDVPDMSVPANAIDKAIDGINSLNTTLGDTNIGVPKLVNASTDMNNVGAGFYYQRYGSSAMPLNAPADQYNAYITVREAGETGLVQEWYSMNTKKLWTRQLTASGETWTAWKQVSPNPQVVTAEYVTPLFSFTSNVDSTHSENVLSIYRVGRLVVANFQVRVASSVSGTEILTMPDSLRPITTSRGIAMQVATSSYAKYCGVDRSGSTNRIYINGLSNCAGKTMIGVITYFLYTMPTGNLVT